MSDGTPRPTARMILALERQIDEVKAAPIFGKAERAESALEAALAILRTLDNRIAALERLGNSHNATEG